MSSAGAFDLGDSRARQLGGGSEPRKVAIDAQDGPPAVYSLTIRPLPVQVSNAASSAALIAPGADVTQTYRLDGDTKLTATVVPAAGGAPLRVLASDLAVDAGSHSLTWDGRNQAGGALADGSYTVHLESHDPYGGASAADTSVSIDGTVPEVAAQVPANATSALLVTATDTSGVVSLDAGVDLNGDGDASDYNELNAAANPSVVNTALSVRIMAPSGGWVAGKSYTVVYTAKDRAGNVAVGSTKVTIPAAKRERTTARVPTLSVASARFYVRRLVRNKLGSGMAATGSYRMTCKRVSRLRFNCRFTSFIGDSFAKGSGQVWYTPDPADDEVHYRIRGSVLDEYCRYALKKSLSRCSRSFRWTN